MAAPTDSARVATNISTAATSHAINVGSPVAGTLLIVFIRFAAAPGVVSFPGYILLVSDSSDASDDTTNIYYRPADGTEGASDTLTTVNSVKLGAISWEVTGAETIQAPSISTVNVGTTAANTCQSNSVAPTNAPQDTLYITMGGEDGEVGAFTAAPTNYVNLQAANSGTGGAAATNVLMGGASRQISASSSDDAGVFTHAAATTGWTAFAIAIRPPIGTPTQLFMQDTVPDTHLGTDNANLVGANVGWTSRALATTRGPGVVASDAVATVAGPTAGLEVTKTDRVEWLTPPVAADVTISGTILANIWASEAAATGNVAINVVIEVVRASDLTGLDSSNALVSIATTTNTNEVALTTRNDNLLSVVPGASVAVNRGDRLRVRVFGDDAGTMGAATTFNASWAGTTARADGDTFLTFSEAITFESAPSGTQLFLTNVQSGLTYAITAPSLVSSFAGGDESPLSEGGNWANLNSSGTALDLISNAVGMPSASTGQSYWTPANFGPDVEAYATITAPAVDFRIMLRIQGEGGAASWDGYQFLSGTGITEPKIRRIDNAAITQLVTFDAAANGVTWAAGDKMGASCAGSVLSLYRQASGESTWRLLCSASDATYASAGKIGLGTSNATARMDDFYAGTNTNIFRQNAPTLISDFTGADENPLSEGGNWANLSSSVGGLQRISNAVGSSGAAQTESYWTPANFGPDLEAYVTISTLANFFGILVRVQGEGGANTYDGYAIYVSGTTTSNIASVTNRAFTTIFSPTGITWASGDKLGARLAGSTIQMWRQASGSSDWNLVGTVIDTTYASAGKVALFVSNTTARLDDFYAATDSNLFTQQAWTSRGAGVVSYRSDTDAGWVAPLYTTDWYTPQLTAFTLTGLAQANIRALESSTSANASLRCEVARVESDGTSPTVWASWCCAPTGTDNGELTTSEVARTINVSGDDLAVSDGQRLRIRLYNEDISSAAMANAFNVQPFYNGTSAAASGDSYVTLAQSVTEFVSGLLPDGPELILQAVNRGSVW